MTRLSWKAESAGSRSSQASGWDRSPRWPAAANSLAPTLTFSHSHRSAPSANLRTGDPPAFHLLFIKTERIQLQFLLFHLLRITHSHWEVHPLLILEQVSSAPTCHLLFITRKNYNSNFCKNQHWLRKIWLSGNRWCCFKIYKMLDSSLGLF